MKRLPPEASTVLRGIPQARRKAITGAHEGTVIAADGDGVYVTLDAFGITHRFGPCLGGGASATIGARVLVMFAEGRGLGSPWIVRTA